MALTNPERRHVPKNIRRKISLAHKRNWRNLEFQRMHPGRPHTQAEIRKISLARKKSWQNPEYRKKIVAAKKKFWEEAAKSRLKEKIIARLMTGARARSWGKPHKESEKILMRKIMREQWRNPAIRKMRLAATQRGINKRYIYIQCACGCGGIVKRNLRNKRWKNKRFIRGHQMHLKSYREKHRRFMRTPEQQEIARKRVMKTIQSFKFPHTLSKPFLQVQKILKANKVVFEREKRVIPKAPFLFDLYIPRKRVVIEVNGDYWHANPKTYRHKKLNQIQKTNIIRDKYKTRLLKKHGYKLIVIWERDLRAFPEKVEKLILKKLGLD